MPLVQAVTMTKDEAGAYFKALRLRKKLRLQDVVDGTTIPNAQYLSALEGGRYNILNSEHFPSLVRFFGLSSDEVQRINPTAVINFTVPDPLEIKQPGYHPEPMFQPHIVKHYGTVGAGLSPSAYAEAHPEYRTFPNVAGLEGYRDDELFTLDVIGDSMTCEKVQRTIPEGSTAIFYATNEAQNGDIVAVWLEKEQKGVLKMYDCSGGYVVLRSYNDNHKPITLEPGDCDMIQGVYLTHIAPVRHRKIRRS